MKLCISLFIAVCAMSTAVAQNTYSDLYSHGLELIKAKDYTQAIETLNQAYEVASAKSQDRSKALWAKGMALYMMAQDLQMGGDYEDAYKRYADAMKCFRRVRRDKDVIDCAKSMAVLNANHLGYKDLALEQYEYAFDIAKELNLAEDQAEILREIIAIKKSLHDEKEVAIYNTRLDSLNSANPSLANNLFLDKGNKAFQNGDWEVTISYFRKFLDTDPKDDKRFFALQRLRDAYAKMGDDTNALVYSRKCVEDWVNEFRDDPSQKYLIYRNHFPFQIKVGDYDGALASIDSLQISISATGTDAAKSELLIDRARLYSKMGRWDDAVKDYKTADSILCMEPLTADVKNKLKILVGLYAGALCQIKDLEDSYRQYIRYSDIIRDLYGEKSMEYANALCYLANIEGFLNRLNDGTRHYIDSWHLARDIAMQDLQFLPANARGNYWSGINDLMWNMIPYGIAANSQEDDFTASAFEALMFSKGLLLSAEKSTVRQVQDSGDDTLISDFMAVANLRNEIEQLRANGKGDEIMSVYAQMDSLDLALSLQLIRRNISPVIAIPSTSDIANKIDYNSILIDFADYTKNDGTHIYAAFLLKKGMTAPKLIKVFEQSSLENLIELNNGKYSDLYEDYNSEELYNIILKPLEDEMKLSDRIYFVPSGILNQIAVEAMKMPDGSIFGEKYEVVRLTNSKELLNYSDNTSIKNLQTAWLYGDLDYDVDSDIMSLAAKESEVSPLFAMRGGTTLLNANEGFKKLKMSEAEVMEIDEVLTNSNVTTKMLTKAYGTEESFVSMSGNSPDMLLVSTHGFYYSPENVPSWSSLNGYDNPMYLTGLVLSGGNAEYLNKEIPEGVMGGLLTSSDIADLDLSGTQIVVLSACETGLGDTTNEGVYGLQRAFKKAGAQTLVLSLWPVSDAATKEFMILFHKELVANGWNKRSAFKKAKYFLRLKYEEPYYWAAFVMID